MTDDLRSRAEQFDEWLREGGNGDVADLLRDLLEALTRQQDEGGTLRGARDEWREKAQTAYVTMDHREKETAWAANRLADSEAEIARLERSSHNARIEELTSDQLARIFADIQADGHERAAWDALSNDDRYTLFAVALADLAAARQSLTALQAYAKHTKGCEVSRRYHNPHSSYPAVARPSTCTCGLTALTAGEREHTTP